MERRRFSQTMASDWQTAFVVSHKMPWCGLFTDGVACSLTSRITTKVMKNCKTFSSRLRPNVQDQDFMIQDQDQDFHFCPRDASRPRPWSRGLHHCYRVAMLHRARKRNSPYTLHAISLESRMIVLHTEIMFIRQLGMQVQ